MISKSKKEYINFKRLIICILFIVLVATNVFTLALYLETTKVDYDEQARKTEDEISRTKLFIKDWYDEMSAEFDQIQVFRNEIKVSGSEYTLTVASDRIRVVYPKGVRFFQLEYINYIEFFEENGEVRCQLYYGENEQKIITIKHTQGD